MILHATQKDIPVIRNIALQTWPVAYGEILSTEQMDYMLEMMYSESSLREQMQAKKFIIFYNEMQQPQGFAGYYFNDDNVCKLDKLYVLPTAQCSGAGKKLLQVVETDAKDNKANILRLNVNIHNKAKGFYERNGFIIAERIDVPIGNGYFMNDYVMEKSVM